MRMGTVPAVERPGQSDSLRNPPRPCEPRDAVPSDPGGGTGLRRLSVEPESPRSRGWERGPYPRGPDMTTEPAIAPSDTPAAFRRTELQRLPAALPGWEIVQSLAEIPEGIASGRHSHPGPEVGYIVRGDVSMEFDDRTPLMLHSGDPFLIPPGVIHNARNVGTVTTMMLSTYVVDDTKPLATLYG